MTPFNLSFNFRDIFLSPRIALSGKKIWVFLSANLLGYVIYWVSTYFSIYLSGFDLFSAISEYGLYPYVQNYELSFISKTFYNMGIFSWLFILFLASAAVNRITLKQLKGNEFFSAKDSWSFVYKHWHSIIFAPLTILIIIVLFIVLAGFFGILGRIPLVGPFFISIPYIIYFFGSIFTIYTIFVFFTSINSSPSIVAIYEEDTMGTVFQSYSITWSQPWRLIVYNTILLPLVFISVQILTWFWLSSIGFIEYVFGNNLAMGESFLNISNYATSLVFPAWMANYSNEINTSLSNLLNFKFKIPLLFPLFENISNGTNLPHSFPGIILSISYFLIGLSIFSYALSIFSVGQALIFIIFKKKSDDDDVLERKDEDEINEELNNENGLDEFSDILESTTDENKTSITDELTSEKE